MADPVAFERDAEYENSEGHYESFAAQHFKVQGDRQAAYSRLAEAAQHYHRAAYAYAEAARQRASVSAESASGDRERAKGDYGRAASDYWYAGRAYADAQDFEHAAEEMEGAGIAYVAEANLREQDGETPEAMTLRLEGNFRYLDAQRYYLQAAARYRSFAATLEGRGKIQAAAEERERAAGFEQRSESAALHARDEGPRYHAAYEHAYRR